MTSDKDKSTRTSSESDINQDNEGELKQKKKQKTLNFTHTQNEIADIINKVQKATTGIMTLITCVSADKKLSFNKQEQKFVHVSISNINNNIQLLLGLESRITNLQDKLINKQGSRENRNDRDASGETKIRLNGQNRPTYERHKQQLEQRHHRTTRNHTNKNLRTTNKTRRTCSGRNCRNPFKENIIISGPLEIIKAILKRDLCLPGSNEALRTRTHLGNNILQVLPLWTSGKQVPG